MGVQELFSLKYSSPRSQPLIYQAPDAEDIKMKVFGFLALVVLCGFARCEVETPVADAAPVAAEPAKPVEDVPVPVEDEVADEEAEEVEDEADEEDEDDEEEDEEEDEDEAPEEAKDGSDDEE